MYFSSASGSGNLRLQAERGTVRCPSGARSPGPGGRRREREVLGHNRRRSCHGSTARRRRGGGGRLDQIRAAGAITLGFPETALPFAYRGADQEPVGYSIDICKLVAERLKAQLDMPALRVRYVAVSSATRIPLLANGTIDLECGSTTNNVARHEFVSFAPTTFVAQVVLVARRDSGLDVDNMASFRGKSVAAQAGGEDFRVASRLNARGSLGITVVPANDTAQTFLMVESGRVAAMVQDDGLAYAAVAAARHPGDFVIGTKGLEAAPYAIVEPRDDPEFKKAVDDAVLAAMADGQVAALYEKWFMNPVPPAGLNLRYPMSDVLRRALTHPTDSGDPEAYR